MKLLYRPVSLLAGTAGGMVSSMVFGQVWKRLTGGRDAPEATDRRYAAWQVVLTAAVQGAIFGAVKAAVDRAGATGYQKATGSWPGDE